MMLRAFVAGALVGLGGFLTYLGGCVLWAWLTDRRYRYS